MPPRKINPSIFRAYDIRGVWGKTITPRVFDLIARAFATDLIRKGGKTVCVGYDVRPSSHEIEEIICNGLIASGLEVINIGMGPSPMLYFAQKTLDTDAGLMITGSHNPSEYNGLKICLKSGPFYGDDILHLQDIAESEDFVAGHGVISKSKILHPYVDSLLKDYSLHYSAGSPLKVAWDPANGAACEVVEALVKRLPGQHIVINGQADGTFPSHHPDPCIAENMKQLADVVVRESCDLGIGLDGDGDRIGVVDGKGRLLMGDQLLAFLAEEVAKTHAGGIVLADVKSSQVLFDRLSHLGLTPRMTRTGHSHIKALMKDLRCPLAGEMSGHVFYADRYHGFDDGLYTALRLIGALSLRNDSFTNWHDALPKTYITPEQWHICEDTRKFECVEEITFNLKEEGADFCDADGVRVNTPDGWWLLRASNTQAVLVTRAESQTEDGLKRLTAEVSRHLSGVGILNEAV